MTFRLDRRRVTVQAGLAGDKSLEVGAVLYLLAARGQASGNSLHHVGKGERRVAEAQVGVRQFPAPLTAEEVLAGGPSGARIQKAPPLFPRKPPLPGGK